MNETTQSDCGKTALPGEKVAEMVLSSLGTGTRIHFVPSVPGKSGHPEVMVIDGLLQGSPNRVLIQDWSGAGSPSRQSLTTLVEQKKGLMAKAAFLCVSGKATGELLLLANAFGIVVVEASEGAPHLLAHFGSATVVRHVTVQSWSLTLMCGPGQAKGRAFDEGSPDLLYRGRPIRNWLCRESRKLIQKAERDCVISVRYSLKRPLAFESEGKPIETDAMEAWFTCLIRNRVHSPKLELAALRYHPRLGKILPAAESTGGAKAAHDPIALMREDAPVLGKTAVPGPELHVFHPVGGAAVSGMPDLDREFAATKIEVKYR